MWDKLVLIHESKSEISVLLFQQRFHELKMRTTETVEEYFSRAETLRGQLEDLSVEIDSKTFADRVVMGLPRKFTSFISGWMNSKADKRTAEDLLPRLMNEDAMLSRFDKEDKFEEACVSAKDSNQEGCFYCKGKDHWIRECAKLKAKMEREEQSEAIVATTSSRQSKGDWLLDSGATEHMTFDRGSYSSYEELERPRKVRLANGKIEIGIGKGTVRAVTSTGRSVRLEDVLHVPTIDRKLLSLSTTTDKGKTVVIRSDGAIVKDKSGKTVFVAKKLGHLYVACLQEVVRSSEANSSERQDRHHPSKAVNKLQLALAQHFGHDVAGQERAVESQSSLIGDSDSDFEDQTDSLSEISMQLEGEDEREIGIDMLQARESIQSVDKELSLGDSQMSTSQDELETTRGLTISDQQPVACDNCELLDRLIDINTTMIEKRGLASLVSESSGRTRRRSLSRETMMCAIGRAIDLDLSFLDMDYETNAMDEID
jgi:hypothetical protein